MLVIFMCERHVDNDLAHLHTSGFYVGILYNVSMLQAFEPATGIAKALGFGQPFTWNGPAWSIAVELWGNLLLAPILVAFAFSRWRLAALTMLTFAAGSYALLATTCLNLSCEDTPAQHVFSPLFNILGCHFLRGLGAMSLGVLCCGAVRCLRNHPQHLTAAAPVALVSGGVLTWLVFFDGPNYGDFAAIATSLVLIASVALYEHRQPLLAMPRLSAALLSAGALSYAVYLMHSHVIVLANLLCPGWIKGGLFPTLLITLLAIGIAFPVYYLFELPMKRATKAWLSVRWRYAPSLAERVR